MENVENINIKYDGDAFSENTFEIKSLGQIFQAIGVIFEQSNNLINKKNADFVVNVDSKFQTGCFEFLVEIKQFVDTTALPMLAGQGVTGVLNAYTIISLLLSNKGSVFSLLKFLNGIKPVKIEKKEPKKVLVYKDETHYLEVTEEALILFEDKKVRQAVGLAIADSLGRNGVENITFASKETINKITKEERNAFYPLIDTEEEILDEEIIESELEIVSMSFDPTKKWEFRSYKDTFTADIDCLKFKKQIEQGENFKKGDMLKTILKIEYYKTEQQLRKKRTIMQVISHYDPNKQLGLF